MTHLIKVDTLVTIWKYTFESDFTNHMVSSCKQLDIEEMLCTNL